MNLTIAINVGQWFHEVNRGQPRRGISSRRLKMHLSLEERYLSSSLFIHLGAAQSRWPSGTRRSKNLNFKKKKSNFKISVSSSFSLDPNPFSEKANVGNVDKRNLDSLVQTSNIISYLRFQKFPWRFPAIFKNLLSIQWAEAFSIIFSGLGNEIKIRIHDTEVENSCFEYDRVFHFSICNFFLKSLGQ